MFVVLMTLDLTRAQIRMLVLAFIIGVTISVLIGLVGGVKVPTDTSALRDDGRLRGGLDDPNYLAAGIVPSLALAAGLFPGMRSALGRFAAGRGLHSARDRPRGHRVARRADRGLRGHLHRGDHRQAGTRLRGRVPRDHHRGGLRLVRQRSRRVQARDPHGGQGQRAQQPLDRGRADLEGPPDTRGGARQLPGLRTALRGLRGTPHVRGLHRRASPRRAQRVPPDDGGGGPRGPGALPDHPHHLAGAGHARGAEVRAQGGLRVVRPQQVGVRGPAVGADRLVLPLERVRIPDLDAAVVRADPVALRGADQGGGPGARPGAARPLPFSRPEPALQA